MLPRAFKCFFGFVLARTFGVQAYVERSHIAGDDVVLQPTVVVEALASVLRVARRSHVVEVVSGRDSQLPSAGWWVVHVGDPGVVGGCRWACCEGDASVVCEHMMCKYAYSPFGKGTRACMYALCESMICKRECIHNHEDMMHAC